MDDLRILIFTEYDDTKRYLMQQLRPPSGHGPAEQRIEVYHGPRRRTNATPSSGLSTAAQRAPVRILIATDAAREGLNLQAHCWNLFHFDVPWNPSRMEQRNGRIDRKLQPAPRSYTATTSSTPSGPRTASQGAGPQDRRPSAKSWAASPRWSKPAGRPLRRHPPRRCRGARAGNRRGRTGQRRTQVTEEELEDDRERQDALQGRSTRSESARRRPEVDRPGQGPLPRRHLLLAGDARRRGPRTGRRHPAIASAFCFPRSGHAPGADPTWADTLDTLRTPPKTAESLQMAAGIAHPSVVFERPAGIDDESSTSTSSTVSFSGCSAASCAGLRPPRPLACLPRQTADAIPRVVLLGRLSLYGAGAARLHEELYRHRPLDRRRHPQAVRSRRTAARPSRRRSTCSKIRFAPRRAVPSPTRLPSGSRLPSLSDIARPAPAPRDRGQDWRRWRRRITGQARPRRGRRDAPRSSKSSGSASQGTRDRDADQLMLGFNDGSAASSTQPPLLAALARQRRRRSADGAAAHPRFLQRLQFRIEPVGLAYLWPVTG